MDMKIRLSPVARVPRVSSYLTIPFVKPQKTGLLRKMPVGLSNESTSTHLTPEPRRESATISPMKHQSSSSTATR